VRYLAAFDEGGQLGEGAGRVDVAGRLERAVV